MRNKARKITIAIGAFFLIAIAGCVSTRAIRYETSYREPKPANFPMEIFEASDITRPYKVIGIVQANAGKLHSTKNTIKHLKTKARKMGGDALMDLNFGPSKGRIISKTGYGYVSGSVREIWTAKVVVWLDKEDKKAVKKDYQADCKPKPL